MGLSCSDILRFFFSQSLLCHNSTKMEKVSSLWSSSSSGKRFLLVIPAALLKQISHGPKLPGQKHRPYLKNK
jgi:hypothetical protein